MVKLMYCLRRLPNLSREEFQRYWRENHGPLVQKHATTTNVHRYVQVHTFEDDRLQNRQPEIVQPEPYDGVAELWWERIETCVNLLTFCRQYPNPLIADYLLHDSFRRLMYSNH